VALKTYSFVACTYWGTTAISKDARAGRRTNVGIERSEGSIATVNPEMEELAKQVRSALASADVEAYGELLHPNVHWGAPDDPESGCHNREEALGWYRRGRAKGVRARVTETLVQGDKILVGMTVTGRQASKDDGGQEGRWQVLSVAEGKIVDICGFEDRDDAVSRLR
jgi:ketosteroid isomerase-like protein